MSDPSPSKSFTPSSMNVTSWMRLLETESLSSPDQALFLKGLEEHPEWVNQSNEWLITPLMRAIDRGHMEVIQRLIRAGANVNCQDKAGWTALIEASINEHAEVVKVLIDAKADLNLQDKNGWTALMVTSTGGDQKIVEALVQAGANLNLQDKDGWTALIWAAEQEKVDVVKILTKARVDLNVQDREGWTALMWASYKGYEGVVKHLIQAGADLKVRNDEKETAWDLAKKNGNNCISDLLKAYEDQKDLNKVIGPLKKTLDVIRSKKKTKSPSSKVPRL